MENLYGYARVSTEDQKLDLQIDALIIAGCSRERIFIDKASGAKADRPGLENCLKELGGGDTLLVWRLDRLGRSMAHLVTLVEDLKKKGIGFKSVCDGAIDTTNASGELVFNIFSALAKLERNLIKERTRAGLEAARARGLRGGRKKLDPADPKIQTALVMHWDKNLSINAICKSLDISRSTFYRYLSLGKEG